jgi:hypothetical protein
MQARSLGQRPLFYTAYAFRIGAKNMQMIRQIDSRCKTGWRIVWLPFGPKRWFAHHAGKRLSYCRETFLEAHFDVYLDTKAREEAGEFDHLRVTEPCAR